MAGAEQSLVQIVRDFLDAHQLMHQLLARARDDLRFEELQELVGDSEASVLFRLKERCHELFRVQDASETADREALFDLAVGSLFHEAMSLREDFYQREVYGPRVRALRERADADSAKLFDEFERILGTLEGRLLERRDEAFALVDETALQLRRLLVLHADDGLVARYLVEHADRAARVFGLSFEELLEKIHGSAWGGYACAGLSYLEGGHYRLAHAALDRAVALGGTAVDPGVPAGRSFSLALAAYLERDHATCISELLRWAEHPGEKPATQLALGRNAVAGAIVLAQEDDAQEVVASARRLAEQLGPEPAPAPAPAG